MSDWNLPWQGGCRCARIRFQVTAPPLLSMACHCTGCQRMTASAFSLSIAIPAEGFSVTRGTPVIGGLHGPDHHHFCAYCMSWLFTRPEGLDAFVNLRATMLDDASWCSPFIETWTSEKLAWATTPAIYSFATLPALGEFPSLIEAYARNPAKPTR